jgi:ectoine hydroxylase-related dioxygenase (phytanoyl-CoA dioxygenase family)
LGIPITYANAAKQNDGRKCAKQHSFGMSQSGCNTRGLDPHGLAGKPFCSQNRVDYRQERGLDMADNTTLLELISRQLSVEDVPLANSVENNIPVYDCSSLDDYLSAAPRRQALKAEIAKNMLQGSGIFVLKGAFADTGIVDDATAQFKHIIAREKADKGEGADHFATADANDRIWNSLEKLCLADTEIYARYHSNAWIELASEAWLGPAFQMTAQVNLVRPGGKAQEAHCDYHLGFLTADQVRSYPAHVHRFSPQLTLQGAVAHCDMPIQSGTTKLLPFSQNWPQNYQHYRDREVRELFENHHVQLPLEKGDLLFFSPGLLHAAGDNVTEDVDRMANLLQVSSAFGQAMETIDRVSMCKRLYPVLLAGDFSTAELHAAITSTGEGYPFPTNLDRDPPLGGLAPQSQQQLMHQGLDEGWTTSEFNAALDNRETQRRS